MIENYACFFSFEFNSMLNIFGLVIASWCNGNTKVSGSFVGGSNPPEAADSRIF
jgi:hypothetical protein